MSGFDIDNKLQKIQDEKKFVDHLLSCNLPKYVCRSDVGISSTVQGKWIKENYFDTTETIPWQDHFKTKKVLNFHHTQIQEANKMMLLFARTVALRFVDLYYGDIFDYLHMDYETLKDVEQSEVVCISDFYNYDWRYFPEQQPKQQEYFEAFVQRFLRYEDSILLISSNAPISSFGQLDRENYSYGLLEFLRVNGRDIDLESGIGCNQQSSITK